MRVAVVGAGIVGASVAYRLSQGGAQVSLIDRDGPASGTTSASFAWLNANSKTPHEYFRLNRAGMEEHLRLRDELPGGAPWLHASGNLIWAENRDFEELERRVERLRSWGYAAEWRSAFRVGEELEPCLAIPKVPVAHFPDEGWVDAPLLTNTLTNLALEAGTEAHFGTPVEHVGSAGGRIEGIGLSDGRYLRADSVVNAAGPEADRVAAMVGRNLPLNPKSGLLARVAVGGEFVNRLVHTPHVNLRPDGPGRLLLHHGSVDERLAGGESKEALGHELLERARRLVPALGDGEVEEVRVGIRPIPSDGYPSVGGVVDFPGYGSGST